MPDKVGRFEVRTWRNKSVYLCQTGACGNDLVKPVTSVEKNAFVGYLSHRISKDP